MQIGAVTSSTLPLTHIIPQGSILSFLLFTIYTNDLPERRGVLREEVLPRLGRVEFVASNFCTKKSKLNKNGQKVEARER